MTNQHHAPEGGAAQPVAWRFAEGDGSPWRFDAEKPHGSWRMLKPLYAAPPAPSGLVDAVRPEVYGFALLMERELRANDHKPGWKGDDPTDLSARVIQEASELHGEATSLQRQVVWRKSKGYGDRGNGWGRHNLELGYSEVGAGYAPATGEQRAEIVARIASEAADVANMAMMVADVCGCLDATLSGQQGGAVPAGDRRLSGLDLAADIADQWHQRFLVLRDEETKGNGRWNRLQLNAEGAAHVLAEIRAERARLAEQPAPTGTGATPLGQTVLRALDDPNWTEVSAADVSPRSKIGSVGSSSNERSAGTGADGVEGLRKALVAWDCAKDASKLARQAMMARGLTPVWCEEDALERKALDALTVALRAALDANSSEEGRS